MQRVFDTPQGLRAFVYQNNIDNNSYDDYSVHGWLYSETRSSWYLPEFGSKRYLGAYTDLEIRDTGEVIYVDRQKITSLSNHLLKIWEKSLDQFLPASSGYPYYARGVELGVDGTVYCILEYKNILSGDFDSCLIRIDSDGEATFSKNLGGNWIEDFKTDKSGNVYIVSRTRSGWNSTISKIDKTGVILCEAPLGFLASRIRIAIDASESIYLYSSTTDSRVIGRASDSFVPFVSKVVLPLSTIPTDVSPVVRGNSLYTIADGPSWTQAKQTR